MLVKVLGASDILIGLILISGIGVKLPSIILLFSGIILLIKAGFGLLRDFAS